MTVNSSSLTPRGGVGGGGPQNINPPQSELIIALEMTLTLCTLSTNLYRTKIVSEK